MAAQVNADQQGAPQGPDHEQGSEPTRPEPTPAEASTAEASTGEAPIAEAPTPTGRKAPRLIGRDMLLSMGLVTAVLLGWLLLAHPLTPDPVRSVEWQQVADAAAETADYEVLAPSDTWDWRATSARIEPQPDGTIAWMVGFYTDGEHYAGLMQRGVFPEQAAVAQEDWVDAQTRQGEPEGRVHIAGRDWTRMEGDKSPDERRSLVRVDKGTVTVITGSAPWSELEELATALRHRTAD